MERVNFNSNGLNVVGNLYFPKSFEESKQYPTIVVAHPVGAVKEQTAG